MILFQNMEARLINLITLSFVTVVFCSGNKYSKEANLKDYFDVEPEANIRELEKPFRIAKLNLLWGKGRLRLSESKMKSLYVDLKLQDKEEIALKHLKASSGDKDGLKEAEVRKKLIGIMSSYDLLEHFEELADVKKLKDYDTSPENYMNKNIFKDKKLNKLWMKAEMAGFSGLELQVLKEEFSHHQDKLDQYHFLLKDVETEHRLHAENSVDEDLEQFNVIEKSDDPKESFDSKITEVRNKGREIKDSYDRLERLAAQGPNSKEFVEPKVQNLWKQAVNSNFTPSELQSLRTELHHYEKRLLKLRNLHMEAAMGKHEERKKLVPEGGPNTIHNMEDLIQKQSRKIEKLHADLHSRIASRTEL